MSVNYYHSKGKYKFLYLQQKFKLFSLMTASYNSNHAIPPEEDMA